MGKKTSVYRNQQKRASQKTRREKKRASQSLALEILVHWLPAACNLQSLGALSSSSSALHSLLEDYLFWEREWIQTVEWTRQQLLPEIEPESEPASPDFKARSS